MAHGIGISLTDRIAAGIVSAHAISGSLLLDPEDPQNTESLHGVPAEAIVERIAEHIRQFQKAGQPTHVGLAMPGIIQSGIVEDSPNLHQFKGVNIKASLASAIEGLFGPVPVTVSNDAISMAAAVAASRGQLGQLTRLWFLGEGIGYGRYPAHEGVWEAGHSVVTLDPKETYCGCGGKGHLEGIMGHRAMRLRFMDLEPDEVFQHAEAGEERCIDFVKLFHRALAAATATSIHTSGPGKFYITGPNARFINLSLLNEYLHEMVQLSPLQNYSLETIPGGEALAVVGAAVIAGRAAGVETAGVAG
jgi:predicted NBD/HSP70 family sugar kinase